MRSILNNKVFYIIVILLLLKILPDNYPDTFEKFNFQEIISAGVLYFGLPFLMYRISKQSIELVVLIFVYWFSLILGLSYSVNAIYSIPLLTVTFEILKMIAHILLNIKNVNWRELIDTRINILNMKYENVIRLVLTGLIAWFTFI